MAVPGGPGVDAAGEEGRRRAGAAAHLSDGSQVAVERVATESGLGIMSVQASVRLGEASDGQAVTVAMTSANRIADIVAAQSVLRFLDPRYPDLGASLSVETRTALGYSDEAEKP